jgi:hypothetical protein
VISDLILIGCKLVQHGRRMILRIWDGNPWLPVFNEPYTEFLLMKVVDISIKSIASSCT